jgi:hypothetical protein
MLLLIFIVPVHAYQSVEWTDTGEFEFETVDELWVAITYWANRSLTTLDPIIQSKSEALQDGKKLRVLTLALDEPTLWQAVAYWLSNQWYSGEVYILKTRRDDTDAAGNKHYRVYFGVRNPPLIKR